MGLRPSESERVRDQKGKAPVSLVRIEEAPAEMRAGRIDGEGEDRLGPRESRAQDADRDAAISKTLSWADEAAAAGDFGAALFLLSVVQASGSLLSPEFLGKQHDWTLAELVNSRS